ncbi:MAG: prephenate dehydrogenase [Prevotellaceae bacterium]|jgi:prephenate dehydrogenase|nr:prephenate dehydrogenase [Prevotellaceae bacterium]
MTITVIGTGLIGGSLAIDLRETGFGSRFIGVDSSEQNALDALKNGIVDEIMTLENAAEQSDLIILSIPVDAARKNLAKILDLAPPKTVVTDMGSTKNGICSENRSHPKRSAFVASHPIAGTEFSGPKAAIRRLFAGKKTIICEKELSSDFALTRVEEMFKALEMDIIYMQPDTHDMHLAFVSHISHISSFALGKTVLNIEKDEKSIFDIAGSGFSSTVRLAKSSPETWLPIFMQNSENISFALNNYIEQLQKFKACIDLGEADKLKQMMSEANEIGRIIDVK